MLTNNKIGKYLLYAIGEIMLVVIGILIAVSINNWNEGKKRIKLDTESGMTYTSKLQNLSPKWNGQ